MSGQDVEDKSQEIEVVTVEQSVEPGAEEYTPENATGHGMGAEQESEEKEDVEDEGQTTPVAEENGPQEYSTAATAPANKSRPSNPIKTEKPPSAEEATSTPANEAKPEANGQPQEAIASESAPPTPIEKSPPAGARSPETAERPHMSRPGTPLTARLFGRRSTSDSPHSPAPSLGHARKFTMSQGNTVSVVLISSALETIAASREAKRSGPLREAVEKALNLLRSGEGGDKPSEIFEPLRLACETQSEKLQIASLDCISKLIAHSFFVDTEPHEPGRHHVTSPPMSPALSATRGVESQANLRPPSLVDSVTHTITACHTETTPDTVSLQIVKALLSLVLSSNILVHQSSLLKAVRTVYNIFLMSPDPVNQTVAQGGLTQMVHHVFSRVKLNDSRWNSVDESSVTSPKAENSSLRHSHQTSQIPSTPDTYPLPPLTPPVDPRQSNETEDPRAVKENVESAVADASTIREAAGVQTPAPERATL